MVLVIARHSDLNLLRYLAMVERPLVLWMLVYMDLASHVQMFATIGHVIFARLAVWRSRGLCERGVQLCQYQNKTNLLDFQGCHPRLAKYGVRVELGQVPVIVPLVVDLVEQEEEVQHQELRMMVLLQMLRRHPYRVLPVA